MADISFVAEVVAENISRLQITPNIKCPRCDTWHAGNSPNLVNRSEMVRLVAHAESTGFHISEKLLLELDALYPEITVEIEDKLKIKRKKL